MIDWIKLDKENIARQVDSYKAKHNTDTIEIPLWDFFVMLDALGDIVSEYGYSERVCTLQSSVYEKYTNAD